MTKETWDKYNTPEYFGKHEKKHYKVWRVLSTIGPEETIETYGLEETREAVKGCWDYKVTDSNGKVIEI